jgi:hypothetical protein
MFVPEGQSSQFLYTTLVSPKALLVKVSTSARSCQLQLKNYSRLLYHNSPANSLASGASKTKRDCCRLKAS